MKTCRICGNAAGNGIVRAREMMFGTREEFDYLECADCGCVQICEVPTDLVAHYPRAYYSLAPTKLPAPIRRLKTARARQARGHSSLLGAIAIRVLGRPDFARWVDRSGIVDTARILDVGAGGGDRVQNLLDAGFPHVEGIEPHLDADLELASGATVRRQELGQVDGSYELVMFHHSLEHIPDQLATLEAAKRVLASNGVILIRVPVADSWAWREYGPDWVQLDPPRHLYLHTRESIRRLAEQAGLVVVHVEDDSTPFQEWGSELYRANTPLQDRPRDRLGDLSTRLRRSSRVQRRRARELNAIGEGDQSAFYLARRTN